MPLLLLLAALGLQDPVRVNARLTEDRIEAGMTTVLRVEVETDGPRAQIERVTRLPPGLELVSTRDFDQRQFSLPGGTRRFITREYVLRARAAGQYRIPAIDVVVGNGRYSTRSLLLTVTAGRVAPPDGAVAGAGNVMLRAWLDADTVYVGEQVTLNVEAMFSQEARLRLRRAPEYEAPRPSGFWVQDLPDDRTPSARRIGTDVFEVQSFQRAFFPLSPGLHEIPPARLTYEMRRGMLYAPETFEVRSQPLPLVVLPIPVEGRPEEFTGAVGQFEVRGFVEPSRLAAGEAAVLTVEVEGMGNIKALPPPRLPELDAVEIFPPSEEATSEAAAGRIQGRKTFTWVMIPRDAGVLELPGVQYGYWDPLAERFRTATTSPGTLEVSPGNGDVLAGPATRSLRYLRTAPARGGWGWVRTPGFVLLQGVPLLALLAAAFTRRRRAAAIPIRALRRRRRSVLKDLEERARDPRDRTLCVDAEAFLRSWLAERLGIGPRDAGRPAELERAGVEPAVAAQIVRLLDRLAAARYAPEPPGVVARRAITRDLGSLLERVDRQTPAPRRSRAVAGGTTAALGFLLLAATPNARAAPGLDLDVRDATPDSPQVTAATPDDSAFDEGLAAYDQGRYDDAAAIFDRWVGEYPGDPAGWYNLGTAYHRAGHEGYAVWAWLHVPRLDPRDRDVRHNLQVAGVDAALIARATPPVPLSPDELLLVIALAWWVAAAAASWWSLRRRPAAAAIAAVATLVMLAAVAGWWGSTRAGRTLIVLEPSVLRGGPTLGGEPLAELGPGSGLIPVAGHGDWRRARTLEGREGWIEARAVGAI